MGDVDSLAETIREVGNLQPMVVRPDEGTTESGTLVAGERRYRALKSLGVEEIEVRLFDGDREQARMAEAIENIARKPFTPTETWNAACEIEKALRKKLNVEAGKRMPAGAGQMDETLGRMFDMEASTFGKLRKVMEAHQKAPKKLQPVVDEMERSGSVDRAFKAVKANTTKSKNPQQNQSPADLKRRKCEDADRALGELMRALDEIQLGHKWKKVLGEIKEEIYDKIPKVE
jgi:ParB family chromosome partitioning protein